MATTISTDSPKLTANIADHADVYGGRALVFDGNTDYLTLGVVEELKGGSQKTISAWIKTSNTNNVTILGNTQGGGYNINIYQNQLGVSFHNGSYRNVYTSDFSTNTWHHVVGTYDNRYAKLYIDGELKGTTDSGSNLDLTSVNVAFLIGAEVGGDSNPSGGFIMGVYVMLKYGILQ